MKKLRLGRGFPYRLPFYIGALAFTVFMVLYHEDPAVVMLYQDKMRGSLFAGFLTLGSFLLSLKTGIVIKIKENLFDSEEYKKIYLAARADGVEDSLYGPLQRLSQILSAAVLSALTASIAQLTIGLYSAWWAAAICITLAAIAAIFLLIGFTLIQINLRQWFQHLEVKGREALEKLEKEKTAEVGPMG